MLKVGFKQNGLRFPFVGVVVLAPHQRRRPVRVASEPLIIYDGCGRSVLLNVRLERFRAFEITVRNLESKIGYRIPRNASTVRIKAGTIEVVTILVRLASGKNTAFDFHRLPFQSSGRDAEGDVRGILPVMTDRRV